VLRKLSKEISECYRLSEQARDWAEEATDPSVRRDLLLVEQDWLLLGRSHEFSEALTLSTRCQGRGRR
jgi:hypothetical protein